ncbi:CDP-alcohol phosphatidyltransferase family protein [Acinetobacter soli]|uniref:CDP-alcohol phosphatidyltransferase family protein n=1 Tax=Acinetobacter soli TaxID=487316 RepID=UPI00125FD4B9|nr:CDP-alcohol phosphatidyltransferase family protein [Acinetobacter soli]
MPSIYQLKPAFQNLLRPLVKQLYHKGVTANQVTVLALLISVALAAYLLLHENIAPYLIWLFIPLWMLVRMGFNAIDGMLAREFNQQTMLGAYLNELCDVISDTVLYGCFIAFGFIEPILLVAVIFMAILSEYAGVMAPLIGQARRYDGPMGKSDRAFCFSLLALWIVLASKLNSIISEQILHSVANGLLGIMALLLMLTISNRVRHAIHSK